MPGQIFLADYGQELSFKDWTTAIKLLFTVHENKEIVKCQKEAGRTMISLLTTRIQT